MCVCSTLRDNHWPSHQEDLQPSPLMLLDVLQRSLTALLRATHSGQLDARKDELKDHTVVSAGAIMTEGLCSQDRYCPLG